jgi:hypothetical protein
MNHFSWILSKIEGASPVGGAQVRRDVRDLVDAMLALQGRGASAMVFGMASGSLVITDDERAEAIVRLRSALVAKREAFARAGERELLRELSELAEVCELPQLRDALGGVPRKVHPEAPWLQDVLSGIVILSNSTEPAVDAALTWFQSAYKGANFGGLDVVRPADGHGDVSLLVGSWRDCLRDDVQDTICGVVESLERSVKAVNDGMVLRRAGAEVVLRAGPAGPVGLQLVPWHGYYGALGLPSGPLDAAKAQRLMHEVFPALPRWTGIHNQAPHWLGHGVSAS